MWKCATLFQTDCVFRSTLAFVDAHIGCMCVFLPTEVSQFELALVVDEQVLRLKVSVEDFSLVTVGETTQELEHEDL